jgi:hypothetical protein
VECSVVPDAATALRAGCPDASVLAAVALRRDLLRADAHRLEMIASDASDGVLQDGAEDAGSCLEPLADEHVEKLAARAPVVQARDAEVHPPVLSALCTRDVARSAA